MKKLISKKKKKRKDKSFSDFILFPFTMMILVISLFSFFTCSSNTTSSLFNHSIIKIMSGSMEESGFAIGDTVIIKKKPSYPLEVGDIIAYYHVVQVNNNNETTYLDTVNHDTEIWFHEITSLNTIDGKTLYTTKGSSNETVDKTLVKEEHIVGKYISTPRLIRNVLGYISSTQGIIIILLIPNTILLFFLVFEMINEFERYKLQRKVIKGELLLTDEICIIHHVEHGLSRRKKKYILENASFRLKEEYEKILYD